MDNVLILSNANYLKIEFGILLELHFELDTQKNKY